MYGTTLHIILPRIHAEMKKKKKKNDYYQNVNWDKFMSAQNSEGSWTVSFFLTTNA